MKDQHHVPATITAITPATESANARLASRLSSNLSYFMVDLTLRAVHADQTMAATTVATAMPVVSAKPRAKITAIFFMIVMPTRCQQHP